MQKQLVLKGQRLIYIGSRKLFEYVYLQYEFGLRLSKHCLDGNTERCRLFKPKAALDGNRYVSIYMMTLYDEPFNMIEYAARFATVPSVFVF